MTYRRDWSEVHKERNEAGEPTLLVQALDAISKDRCDCEPDNPGVCRLCTYEDALREQWERAESRSVRSSG